MNTIIVQFKYDYVHEFGDDLPNSLTYLYSVIITAHV